MSQQNQTQLENITNKNKDEGHKEGIDWDRVIKNVKEATVTVLSPIIAVGLAVGLTICGNPRLAKRAYKGLIEAFRLNKIKQKRSHAVLRRRRL